MHPFLPLMILLAQWLGVLPYYLMLFALVFGHEISHSIAARALGVEVLEIELAPFGGVARVSADLEMRPAREIVIAVAGPAFNVLLVLIAALADRYFDFGPEGLSAFIGANLLLAGFNLLPALPLDGGRVLRAALALPLGLERATKIAAGMGVAAGAALFVLGVWSAIGGAVNITYFICGPMLCAMALREGKSAATLYLRDITARAQALKRDGALPVRVIAVPPDTTVRSVVRRFRPRSYHRVVLLDDALRERGEIAEADIVSALMNSRSEYTLWEIGAAKGMNRR